MAPTSPPQQFSPTLGGPTTTSYTTPELRRKSIKYTAYMPHSDQGEPPRAQFIPRGAMTPPLPRRRGIDAVTLGFRN
eukprot:272535-Amorphochlora_amoeboformis.AAC.1